MGEGKAHQRNDDQLKFVFLAFFWTISIHEAARKLELLRQIWYTIRKEAQSQRAGIAEQENTMLHGKSQLRVDTAIAGT